MAGGSGCGMWGRNQNVIPVDPNEKLFLFGYSCKMFRDDEKASYIDKGKHLIPWPGDETLMIDRYDVRGYLHDLKEYEPKEGGSSEELLSEEEKLCDEERYRSLRPDLTDEQLYQEEELKRLRAAIASDGAYHEIGFSYDNVEEKYIKPEVSKAEEPEDELFQLPPGLHVPKGMEVPYNMKIHAIIERTAMFVSEQGGQMEIIIKMKQHSNPQFAFMHLDNPLYPYYKHLVKAIKSGSYKPLKAKKVENRSEDEDDDGHYLHPSLMSGRTENIPKFTVPSINFRRSHDDSYSVLVRNLQQHIVEEPPPEPSKQEVQNMSPYAPEKGQLASYNTEDAASVAQYENNSGISINHVTPPPDVKPIILKMAEYVAKNGEDFEVIVKSRNDQRFDFLNPGSAYYNYYIRKREEAKQNTLHNAIHNVQPVSDSCQTSRSTAQVENTSQNADVSNNEMQNVQPGVLQHSDVNAYETVSVENSSYATPIESKENETIANSSQEEFDALYYQESQDMDASEPVTSEILVEENDDSMDFLDSPSTPKSEVVKKPSKALKGPISFSLKLKDAEAPATDKNKTVPLLLDDSEEDSDGEPKKQRGESSRRRKSTEEMQASRTSRHNSVEKEEKPTKSSESMEAKLAEERIKDKLLAAARERLAQQKKERQLQIEQQKREEQLKKEKQMQLDQQRKEKQLQLERKRKAALFLKMLKTRSPDRNIEISSLQKSANDKKESHDKSGKGSKFGSDFWNLTDTSGLLYPENGILFPNPTTNVSTRMAIPGIKSTWSSDSEVSGEEEFITEYCDNAEEVKNEAPVKHEHKGKKKKRSRSRSKERSRAEHSKSSRRKERRRSRSPSRSKKKEKPRREKELPAAYAFVSRSRSRSPKRYRPSPNRWSRRR